LKENALTMAFRRFLDAFLFAFLLLNVKDFSVCNGELENHKASKDEEELTNMWAVELDTNDEEIAKKIARSFGYEYAGRIGSLPMHYKFVRSEKAPDDSFLKGPQEDDESDTGKHENKRMLEKHPRVKWVEQQKVLVREKQGNVE
jgi:hypothetical protein